MSSNHRIKKKTHSKRLTNNNYPLIFNSSNYIQKWGLLIAIISITISSYTDYN